jgi:RNA polymerase subunit RPABC4/transcription elongation factor Spt4
MDIVGIVLAILALLGAMFAAFWLTLIIWTFRDMRSRSRDIFAQILAALLVAILFVPGVVVYLLLRPKETLAEAYERSLEEEALLQGIEETLVCPGCGSRVQTDFVVCPSCHTKLKKPCQNCGRALNLSWSVCPYCSTPVLGGVQLQATEVNPALGSGRRAAQRAPEVSEAPPVEQA